jgi:hypothetical protein
MQKQNQKPSQEREQYRRILTTADTDSVRREDKEGMQPRRTLAAALYAA